MTTKQFDDTNRGGMWINKRKEKDNHPDYTGSLNVDGVEYWLSAWKKYNVNTGEPFLSISVKKKEVQRQMIQRQSVDDFLGSPKPTAINTPIDSILNEDVPF